MKVHVPVDCSVSGHPYARYVNGQWICTECGQPARFHATADAVF
ncbi:hypothetical protein [Amycolatopsis sp. NPDC059657]